MTAALSTSRPRCKLVLGFDALLVIAPATQFFRCGVYKIYSHDCSLLKSLGALQAAFGMPSSLNALYFAFATLRDCGFLCRLVSACFQVLCQVVAPRLICPVVAVVAILFIPVHDV